MNPQWVDSLRATQIRPKAEGDKPEQYSSALMMLKSPAGCIGDWNRSSEDAAQSIDVIADCSSFPGKACPKWKAFAVALPNAL
jgi:hypothetical protein